MSETYIQLMDRFIDESKKMQGTPELVFQQLKARWNLANAEKPTHPNLDVRGRLMRTDGILYYAPVPLIEKWEGLTRLQIESIRANCCVDELGRWKYMKNGEMYVIPSAYSGFNDSTGKELVVSMYAAWNVVEKHNDDGTITYGIDGQLFDTLRTRFTSISEAEAWVKP